MFEHELQRVEIFQDLGADELRRLAMDFVEIHYPTNDVIFRQGELSEAFYVVKSGSVVLFRETPDGPVEILARLAPGDHFGEFGIYDELRRSVSARVSEPSQILEIKKGDLLRVFTQHPTLALRLQTAAARQLGMVPGLGRRCEVRTTIDKQVVLSLDDGLSMLTCLANVSRGGLCFRGVPPNWQVGQEVSFHLGIGSNLMELRGQIRWLQDDAVGIAFRERSAQHDMKIQWALRQLVDLRPADPPGSAESELRLAIA